MNKKCFLLVFMYLLTVQVICANTAVLNSSVNKENKNLLTNPIAVNTTEVCQNEIKPQFTFTWSGGVAPYEFSYGINAGTTIKNKSIGDSIILDVPTNTIDSLVCNLLTYRDAVGSFFRSTGQSTFLKVNEVPDTKLNGTGKFEYEGNTVFKICGNSASEFEFVNASTTSATNTSYTIDWGDGTTETLSSWTSKKHTYAVGFYNLTYTVMGSDGSSASQTYKVFLGSNPAVGFTAALNADICVGETLTFPLSGTTNNPPGTTYEVSFSDGTATGKYTQADLPAQISHKFEKNSCGSTYSSGSTTISNSFSGTVTATNPCGTAVVSVGPIYVSSPPKAQIQATTNNCINTTVCIQNVSTGSVEVTSGNASCNSTPATVWTITPSTGFTLDSGSSLGNDYGSNSIGLWDHGSSTICPVFKEAGTYTIKMRVGNRCGISEETTTIYVDAPLTPEFSLNRTNGCSSLDVLATNTTVNTNASQLPSYLWNVSYKKGECGAEVPTWNYTNSTDENSTNPEFNFVTSGTYTLKLYAINSCGSVSSKQQVEVSKSAEVTINSLSAICQAKSGEASIIHPAATVSSCTSSGIVTYAWSFPGGAPSTSTDVNPTVSYMPGTYTISLLVTTDCGEKKAIDQVITIYSLPNLVVNNPAAACSPKTIDLWDAAVTAGSDSNLDFSYWTDSDATIALLKPYQVSVSGTYYIKATNKVNGCSVIQPVEVVVNPITNIIGDLEMCLGGAAVQLQTNPINFLVSPWTSSDTSIATITNSGLISSISVGHTDISYTDSKGCQFSKTFYVNALVTIKNNPQATQTICNGGTIDPLTVDYNGGAGTPKYEWYLNTVNSNVGGTLIPSATSLSYTPPAFTTVGKFYYYAVISLSSNGCGVAISNPAEVIVLDNIAVTSQPVLSQQLCRDAAPKELRVKVSGGISNNYLYQWYKNTTNSITGGRVIPFEGYEYYIPPTTEVGVEYYYCTITQINKGCEVSSQPAKVEIVLPPTISENPKSGGVCLDAVAKDLTVSYSNGAGTPQYQWYSNTVNSNISGTLIVAATNSNFVPPSTTLGKMYYYCVISFLGSGCNEIRSNTAQIIVSTYPIIHSIDTFSCSGEVFNIIPSDGSGNIIPLGTTYTWTYPQIDVSNSITGAQAVTTGQDSLQQNLINSGLSTAKVVYTVTPNANGCVGTDFRVTVDINPAIIVNPIVSPIKCSGTNDASISLDISGGTAPYQTTWSNLGGGVSQDNLAAGDYEVSITDSKNCIKNIIITIPEPPLFKINTTVKEISCHGANNGSINLDIIGGKAPLKLVWEDNILAGKDRNNLKPGFYSVAVTDGIGCTITKIFLLVDPQELVLDANVINAFDCINSNSGSINLLVSGGTPPFSYQWSNGSKTEDLTALAAGNYSITVTDSRGCVKQELYNINRQDPITIKVQTNNEFDCDTRYVKQTFVAQVSGGIAPYQYTWLSGQVSGTYNEIMTTNQNGIVVLEIKDGLGCEANYNLNVKIPVLGYPGFSISSIGFATYGLFAIKDPMEFKNMATGDFDSIAWDFGDGSISTEISPKHRYLKEGVYTIVQTVKYPFGCVYSYSTTIKVEKGFDVMIPNAFSPNNDGLNDTFRPVFKGLNKVKLEIFNTWGGLVYSEEGISLQGWNGKIDNSFIENGNYYYKVVATTFYGDVIEYSSPFLLIR